MAASQSRTERAGLEHDRDTAAGQNKRHSPRWRSSGVCDEGRGSIQPSTDADFVGSGTARPVGAGVASTPERSTLRGPDKPAHGHAIGIDNANCRDFVRDAANLDQIAGDRSPLNHPNPR